METLAQSGTYIGEFLTDPTFWLLLFAAVLLAGPVGMIPGVGTLTVVAIALPFVVLNLEPALGIVFIAGILSLNNTMDAIPAVLLGYPTAATQVTFLEGHQLALRGEGARTLGAVYAVSAIGGLVSAFMLALVMPAIRPFIVNFSYAEITVMALFGIGMVSALSRGAVLKGLIAAVFGLLVTTIGITAFSTVPRFTFGELYLNEGLPLIPVLLGIFALPEVVDLSMTRRAVAERGEVSVKEVVSGVRYGLRHWLVAVRQGLIGVTLGIIPGVGSGVIDWMSYALGVSLSKDKSQFGKGSLDGVLFAESAQNAQNAGQAVPTLAFGIPGSVAWALILAGLLSFGLAPGISMLTANLNITIGIVLAIGIGNVLISLLAVLLTGPIAKLTRIPYAYIAGLLLPLIFLSAYQANFSMLDIVVMLCFGGLGMAMKWWGWPRPPFILAYILGPVVERNAWPALQIGDGPLVFLTRPFALGILVLGALFIVFLTWALRDRESQVAQVTSVVMGSDGANEQENSSDRPPRTRRQLQLRWQWENLLWLVMLGWVAIIVFPDTLGFEGPTRFLPFWASLAFFGLIAAIAVQTLFPKVSTDAKIMDIGMRSGTGVSAVRQLLPQIGWLLGFVFAVGIIGFPWAAVLFPMAFIPFNTSLKLRQLGLALIPCLLAATVIFGIMDAVLHVLWPDPFLRNLFF
ncbi:MAG: tripartite tricarboxylate transporter permease [Chloroflexota bacterium]|nr:tripartite tricarboxylate transporter permease [Chloroflexota bacterium]MDE2885176.1 tripartite tricarboxylate transporter permease [Chloroflexota bacterium]